MKLAFKVRVEVDKVSGQVLAAYLRIRNGKVANVEELADGAAFANYNDKGELLGIELLGSCKVRVLDKIAQVEPPPTRNRIKEFFRKSAPREMVLG